MRATAGCVCVGLVAFVLLAWLAGALWTSVSGVGELSALREIASDRTAGLTSAARLVTWAGSVWVLVPLGLCACAVFARAGLYREAVAVAVSLGGAIIISNVAKLLVSRPRPPVEHLQSVTGSSFPSGHSTQASAFWLSLVLALRSSGVRGFAFNVFAAAAFLIVVSVGLSRLYLGVHYPSDVVAGLLLGGGWALFVARCVERPRQPR